MQLPDIKVTRDHFRDIPPTLRKDIPVFGVFFFMTDMCYINVGEYEEHYWSVCLHDWKNRVMNYAAFNPPASVGGRNSVRQIGNLVNHKVSTVSEVDTLLKYCDAFDIVTIWGRVYMVLKPWDNGEDIMLMDHKSLHRFPISTMAHRFGQFSATFQPLR